MIDKELRPEETLEEAEEAASSRAEEQALGAEAERLIDDELAEHPGGRALVSATALVRGYEVDVRNAAVGAVLANRDVTLTRGVARSIFAGGNVTVRQGGSGVLIAGEHATLQRGGAQAVISAGAVEMEQAGSGFAIGRRIRIGRGGLAIFALGGQIEVAEGGRVVVGRPLSAVALGALACLVGLGVLVGRGARRRARR